MSLCLRCFVAERLSECGVLDTAQLWILKTKKPVNCHDSVLHLGSGWELWSYRNVGLFYFSLSPFFVYLEEGEGLVHPYRQEELSLPR